MASIFILLIIAGCAAGLYAKGTFIRAFATFMAALCASIIAFAWFEPLSRLLIGKDILVDWAQSISLLLLFIIAFAVLQTIVSFLTRQKIDLGLMPERFGRIISGILLGLTLSGLLLTAAVMTPISGSFPYQRFDPARPNIQSPKKPLLNPDGFITRLFAITSSGSLGGSKSFAVLHAGFLDQLFLNRLKIDKKVSVLADAAVIKLPNKAALWPAPDNLKDNQGNLISAGSGHELIMTRVGFTSKILKEGGSFTPGQLRLICKEKDNKERLQGRAVNAYPIGYLKSAGRLGPLTLGEEIKLQNQDIIDGVRWIDFAFEVPTGFEPVAVAFKATAFAELPQMVTPEQAPEPVPFYRASDSATSFAKITPITSAKIYGIELASDDKFLEGIKLAVSDQDDWKKLQTQNSKRPAQFDEEKITCVLAELKKSGQSGQNNISGMFSPADGYTLLSLKCNNPAVGSALPGSQLPKLLDTAGKSHYPCGVIIGGKVNNDTIYEIDYCTLTGFITLTSDATVAKPFPDNIWLTERAQSISELFLIYMVKPNTVIVSVKPADAQTGASFQENDTFLAR